MIFLFYADSAHFLPHPLSAFPEFQGRASRQLGKHLAEMIFRMEAYELADSRDRKASIFKMLYRYVYPY
jgi:hypothetical protein